MTTATMTKTDKQNAIEELKRMMPKGSTVYTILRHVSKSGMNREISLVVFLPGESFPTYPNHAAATALGWGLGKEGIKVSGCGMDMGFHLVHSLSSLLYGKDASGNYSHEGAYSLKQRWL